MAMITVRPNEKGTAVVTLSFTDEDGVIVTPNSAEWQLQDRAGNVINERSFENGSFTGDTVVLTGNDLAIIGPTDNGVRVFAIQARYDSSAGSDLHLKDEIIFRIRDLFSQS